MGKTVFAKCLTGILSGDSGTITIDEETIECSQHCRHTALNLGIDYVPQMFPRPNNVTCLEFLSLHHSKKSVFFRPKKAATYALKAAKEFSLELDFHLNTQLSNLSLAQIQKLYLLRALIKKTRLLILDEPTAHLDSEDIQSLKSTIDRICNEGMSVIVISHPYQATLGNQSTYQFSSTGLSPMEDSAASANRGFAHPTDRIHPPRRWSININCDHAGQHSLDMTPGMIVSVQGAPSADFFRFVSSVASYVDSAANNESNAITNNALARPLRVRYIPNDARESRLAEELSILENALINHWDSPEWRQFSFFISEKRAEQFALRPITRRAGVRPDNKNILCKDLSGGNRQRLLIGTVLHGRVDFLTACNLFTGIDDAGIALVGRLIEGMAAEGMAALLFSTMPGPEADLADTQFRYLGNGSIERVQ